MSQNPPLHLEQLRSGLAAPRTGEWRVELKDPARSVMTDFNERGIVTVEGKLQVDAALEVMKHAGVRSAFVLDDDRRRVRGLITAYDVMGEKPLRHLQSVGCTHLTCSRDDVLVEDIMERAEGWPVARLEDVESATVASMLDVFQRTGRTHIAVVESAEGKEPCLRGVFSAAKILRLTEESRKMSFLPPGKSARAHVGR
jgi:CBS domain-containing protein